MSLKCPRKTRRSSYGPRRVTGGHFVLDNIGRRRAAITNPNDETPFKPAVAAPPLLALLATLCSFHLARDTAVSTLPCDRAHRYVSTRSRQNTVKLPSRLSASDEQSLRRLYRRRRLPPYPIGSDLCRVEPLRCQFCA